jgi:hypothetical protein
MRTGNKRKSRRLSHTHKKSSHQHRDVLAYVNKRLKAGRPVAMGHAIIIMAVSMKMEQLLKIMHRKWNI